MQVVWEADTAAFASRKRAARACLQCQKKKKRCNHTFTRPPDQQAETDGLDRVLPNLTHKEPIRFVGDLNPESILTDLSTRSKGAARVSRVGTWIEQSKQRKDELQIRPEDLAPPRSSDKTPGNVEKYGKVEGGRRTLTTHYRNYLQAVGAFRVLPKATQDALVSTYIACIDSVMPIVDGTKLLREYTSGTASIFLIQAICLVICKAPEVGSYLRLYEDGPLLDPIPFARSLHTGLEAAMKADLEPDRITKIQILVLMHLHNDGPGGIEDSSMHLAQAIHDAWTAGLHIHTPGRSLKDQASMLWWTIWTLDRFNACIGGRPIVIADRDIDIARPPLETNSKSLTIAIWIRLGDLLDKVIDFYRPTADQDDTGWETEFPTWSSVLEGIDVDYLPESTTALLELCFNVIAILSCRTGGPGTNSYARRIACADRIQAVLSNGRHLQGPPLPVVPYAVSLSLTVAYRGLRDHFSDPEIAQQNIAARCEMLESLSAYWWTADAMAKLGRKALKSMQQPGVQRKEVAELSNALEAETTVCKFGPFDGKTPAVNSNSTSADGLLDGSHNDSGNALHLLSDAAAARSTNGKNANRPKLNTNRTTSSQSSLHPPPLPHSTNTAFSTTSTDHQTTTTNSSSSLMTPHTQQDIVFPLPSGGYNYYSNFRTQPQIQPLRSLSVSHAHANHVAMATAPAVTTNTTNNISGLANSAAFTTTTPSSGPALDASVFQPYHQFNDLENLFDNFFDLSMPTIFQDPLFDGAAFLDDVTEFDVSDTVMMKSMVGGEEEESEYPDIL